MNACPWFTDGHLHIAGRTDFHGQVMMIDREGWFVHLLGNLIWMIFGGIVSFALWFAAGLACSITIIGIPFGIQCFKIASLMLWPFGKDVEIGRFGLGGLIGNLVWLFVLGWELCVTHLVIGLVMCLTIIGIPFGKQHFKFAKLALVPFGARIYVKSWV